MLRLNIIKEPQFVPPKPTFPRIKKYTREIVLERAKVMHGDKYDYSQIKESDIKRAKSYITIACKTCNHVWSTSIEHHVKEGTGCPCCSGHISWTGKRLLEKASEIHGNIYNYPEITPETSLAVQSIISINCTICNYSWSPLLNNHIHHKSGCPRCAGNAPWTPDEFITRGRAIHGDKFDYSRITNDLILRTKTKVPIKCKLCNYEWNQLVHNHISSGYGCPNCADNAPWTVDKFVSEATRVHEGKYDYSQVSGVLRTKTKVQIRCTVCNHSWLCSVSNHIRGRGCPHCRFINGYSKVQMTWLEGIMKAENIVIRTALHLEGEYRIEEVGKVDGYCYETNTVYEFHGDFWHGNPELYEPEDMNPLSGKTYGALYQRTITRDQKIRDLGYNLIIKWETDLDIKPALTIPKVSLCLINDPTKPALTIPKVSLCLINDPTKPGIIIGKGGPNNNPTS